MLQSYFKILNQPPADYIDKNNKKISNNYV